MRIGTEAKAPARIYDLIAHLTKYEGENVWNSPGKDKTELIYEKDGVEVYWCDEWDYLDIIGLSEEEFLMIADENGGTYYGTRPFGDEEVVEDSDEPIEYKDAEEELEELLDDNAEICQVGISGHDIFEVTNAETGHKFIVWKKED